jgi:hypothetical protein
MLGFVASARFIEKTRRPGDIFIAIARLLAFVDPPANDLL